MDSIEFSNSGNNLSQNIHKEMAYVMWQWIMHNGSRNSVYNLCCTFMVLIYIIKTLSYFHSWCKNDYLSLVAITNPLSVYKAYNDTN